MRTTDRLRAVNYLRVSTEEQAKGNGIAYTGRRTFRHIERKGWEHVGTYSDEGLSGTLDASERDDLTRLMKGARKTPRPFDVVVVYEERAMERKGRAFWPWVWELEDLGIHVSIVKGDYDNTTGEGRARMRHAQGKAEDEHIAIRDRTNGGRDERALAGGYVGGKVPYGYRVEGPAKARTLVVDECSEPESCARQHEADVLRRALTLFVNRNQGQANWRKTAILMNAEGYTTRDGKPWRESNLKARVTSTTVLEAQQVFRNPNGNHTVVDRDGNPAYGETVVIELDPIFSPEEMEELKQARERRPVRAKKSGGRVYVLSGRLASRCGSYYTGFGRNGKEQRHYRCAGKGEEFAGSGPGCDCPRVDADASEKYVWEQVRQFLGDEARLKELVDEHVGRATTGRADFAARIVELDQQITTLRRTVRLTTSATIRQAVEEGATDAEAEAQSAETVRPLRKELEEIEALRREAAAWGQEAVVASQRAQDLQTLAHAAHHCLDELLPAQQAEILALLNIEATIVGEVPKARPGLPCSLGKWFRVHGRSVPDMTHEVWGAVEPLMVVQYRTLKPRLILEALFHKARTSCRWTELPAEYGHHRGIQTQLNRWQRSGLWEEIMNALQGFPGTPPYGHDLTPPMKLTGELIPELRPARMRT